MYISHSFARHLGERDVEYDVRTHARTKTAEASARSAHVPIDQLAKGVVLRSGEKFILAVVPASRRVHPSSLEATLRLDGLSLADEDEIRMLFSDCELGAIPPVGDAYGLMTVVDESLLAQPDVYLEAGDHEHLVHVNHAAFERLMKGALVAPREHISEPLIH